MSLTSLAAPPVPFYPDNVVRVKRISDSSVVVETKDSVTTVCAWYRKNLPDANGEMAVDGGAVIFYTHNGATADVEPGGSTTTIGISWDAKKFGPYVKK